MPIKTFMEITADESGKRLFRAMDKFLEPAVKHKVSVEGEKD